MYENHFYNTFVNAYYWLGDYFFIFLSILFPASIYLKTIKTITNSNIMSSLSAQTKKLEAKKTPRALKVLPNTRTLNPTFRM
ncbi:hypothetical protein L1887_21622 [Cichorium endivia]|nr:hypothetical protein L1887_21622 [Cichorium endivia]